MCELFGISGRKKKRINDELREFYSHSDKNPHGWGLAVFDPVSGGTHIEREDKSAAASCRVHELLSEDIYSSCAMAHIRLATIGLETTSNTHPFTGLDASDRRWTLVHNGTIFECEALNRYVYEQDGETDSERILLYILDRMSEDIPKDRSDDGRLRFDILDGIISEITPENKINIILNDGEYMYVHTNFRDSLFLKHEDGSVFFSSTPLDGGNWEKVPFTKLLAFKDGEIAFEGTDHGNEYIPDEKNIQALYLAYSGL